MAIATADRISLALAQLGVPVLSVKEGNECEDGEINVTDKVSIQVGTFGSYLIVVAELDDETFQFYPERKNTDLAGVIKDVRKALGPKA